MELRYAIYYDHENPASDEAAMTHLDEGTIHAWLDGQLPDAQATAVERHITECAECSALVAEARGFVAGTSRILSALDDIGSAIVPRADSAGAGGMGVAETVRAATGRRRRRWVRPTGWLAAAGLLLAVGVKVAERNPAPVITGQFTTPAVPRIVSVTVDSAVKVKDAASTADATRPPKATTTTARTLKAGTPKATAPRPEVRRVKDATGKSVAPPAAMGAGQGAQGLGGVQLNDVVVTSLPPSDRRVPNAERAAAFSAVRQATSTLPICYGAPVAMRRAESQGMGAPARHADAPAQFARGLMLDTGRLVRTDHVVVGTWSPLTADSVLIRVPAVALRVVMLPSGLMADGQLLPRTTCGN